ncbi:MAG: hypothetical protein ABFS45_26780 [Pseudomonadota bacterium]
MRLIPNGKIPTKKAYAVMVVSLCFYGREAGITRAFHALALRAALRTFKIAPGNFVEPKGSN